MRLIRPVKSVMRTVLPLSPGSGTSPKFSLTRVRARLSEGRFGDAGDCGEPGSVCECLKSKLVRLRDTLAGDGGEPGSVCDCLKTRLARLLDELRTRLGLCSRVLFPACPPADDGLVAGCGTLCDRVDRVSRGGSSLA